jgi:group I intron endonuclease
VIVYLIRNTANGKCYVGKTTGSLARRWSQHKCEARLGRYDFPLYRDMRIFQPHCFEVEVLGEAPTQRRIAQMERKFIRIFDAVEQGYNMTLHSYGGNTRLTRGSVGRKLSAETRRKIQESNRLAWAEKQAAEKRMAR